MKRLKNSGGYSLAQALMLFLITVLAGSIVLTSAGMNLNRVSYQRERQRNYLAVLSAAQLFRDSLKDSELTSTISYSEEEKLGSVGYSESLEIKGEILKLFGEEKLKTLFYDLEAGEVYEPLDKDTVTYPRGKPDRDTLFLPTVSGKIQAEGLEDVSYTLSFDAEYNLTATFELGTALRLTIPAQREADSLLEAVDPPDTDFPPMTYDPHFYSEKTVRISWSEEKARISLVEGEGQ